jgi:WD40 repeat protein
MTADVQFKVVREHGQNEMFLSLARVRGSSRVLAGAADGNVFDLDPSVDKPEIKKHAGHTSFVTGVAVAGDVIVSGSYDCSLIWRKLDGGEIVRQVADAHGRWIRKVIASPDGRIVASVADDMVCRLWEASSGKLLHELRGHEIRTPNHFPSMLYACAFSADGLRLATADKTGRICLWEVASGSKLRVLEAPGFYTWDPKQRIHSIGGTRAVAFSPDGKTLVAGGIGTIGNIDHLDGPARVELFDLDSGESVKVFSGETKGLIEQLLYHPGGQFLFGVGGDNGGLWQAFDMSERKNIRSEKAPMHVYAAELSDDAKQLVAVGHNKIIVWEVTTTSS